MKLLLDSHIAVWSSAGVALLRAAEMAAFAAAEERNVSVVSLWELRLKWDRRHASGDRKGPIDPLNLLRWAERNGIGLLDLTPDVAVARLDPPLAHSDPFDEMLLIQAQQGGYRLLTRDEKLAAHPVALIPA